MIQTRWLAAPVALALAPAAVGLPSGFVSGSAGAPPSATVAVQQAGQIPPPPPGYQWELHPVPEAPVPAPVQQALTVPEAPAGYTWVLLPTEQAPAAARGATGQAPVGGYPPPPQYGVQQQPPPAAVNYPPPPSYGAGTAYSSGDSGGSFHVYLGGRDLDEDIWGPLDDQTVFGIEGHFAPRELGPFEIELGTSISGDEQNDVYLTIGELYGGVRVPLVERRPGKFGLRPYVGGGFTYLHADLENDFVNGGDDGTGGWYARGGLELLFEGDWSFNIDYRYVGGTDVDLAGFGLGGGDTDLDHGQLTIGFGFYL